MKKIIVLGSLLISSSAFAVTNNSVPGPPVMICNPDIPSNCLKPNSDGSLPTTGGGEGTSNVTIVGPLGTNSSANSVSIVPATGATIAVTDAGVFAVQVTTLPVLPTGTNTIGAVLQLPYNSTGGVTAVTVGVVSASALAARSAPQKLLALDNESITASIACNFGGTAALNTAGNFTIGPGQTRTWSGSYVPLDAINCIASVAASPLTVEAN